MGDAALTFRRYEPRDLVAIVELDAACFAPPFRFSRTAMQRYVEVENAWVVVAESAGAIAGFCIVHREEMRGAKVGYVITIDVADAFRRRGIGERMLRDGEAWIAGLGGVAMLLHVYAKNAGAIHFYERSGYERAAEEEDFYGPGADALLYWKRLSL